MGGQASWLLPAALVGLVAVLVARRRAPRTDKVRAAAIVWGGWLLVTGAVFSYGKGVIHTYYTVALAPAIAALVAIGAHQLWKERDHIWARALAAGAVLVTAGWAWVLLDRTPSWNPELRWLVVIAGAIGAAMIMATPAVLRRGRWAGFAMGALVGVACLTGPVAYTADTIATSHTRQHPDRRSGHGARNRRRRVPGWRYRAAGWRRGRRSSHWRRLDGPSYVGTGIPGWCRVHDRQGINGRTPFRSRTFDSRRRCRRRASSQRSE